MQRTLPVRRQPGPSPKKPMRDKPALVALRARTWLLALAWAGLLGLTGCARLPTQPDRPIAASTLTAPQAADTRLTRALKTGEHPPGLSAYRTLSDPLEAYAARMLLIQQAERTLDVQYYIWRQDTTGLLLLDALRQAGQRGVKVRLLLDDNGIGSLDAALSALNALPNIEVRLFNPFPVRWFKPLGYLFEFSRLNRRMHNKALIADAGAAIVGGRNIGDTYFGADAELDFADLDVLVAGAVAHETSVAFEAYWHSRLAYPLETLQPDPPPDEAIYHRILSATLQPGPVTRYHDAVEQTALTSALHQGQLKLTLAPIRLLHDPPEKAEGHLPPAQAMTHELGMALGEARHQLDLISPYFVPGDIGADQLAALAQSGVATRVVTNSLAATDVAAVHHGYARHRKTLLQAGAQLFELKPDHPAPHRSDRFKLGSSSASLHGKALVVDRSRVFIGSMNIDPRSVNLNTEMGVVIESASLAQAISDQLTQRLPALSYEVRLNGEQDIEWLEQTDHGPVVHQREPQASWWRRTWSGLLGWLPIEWLL